MEGLAACALRTVGRNATEGMTYANLVEFVGLLNDPVRRLETETDIIFALFDSDGDGTIGKPEFKELCHFCIGTQQTLEAVERLWKSAVPDGSSNLDPPMFKVWISGDRGSLQSSRTGLKKPRFISLHSTLSHDARSVVRQAGPSASRKVSPLEALTLLHAFPYHPPVPHPWFTRHTSVNHAKS